MPVIYVHRYDRKDARANPDVLYLFGDNGIRKGYGGQAGAMRGERNAVGVRTKRLPSNDDAAFFSDADYDDIITMIDNDLSPVKKHLRRGGIVVVPLDGLGSGLSDLPTRAPRVNAYLVEELRRLEDIEPLGFWKKTE